MDDSLTSLKRILDVIDFHLRARHSEDALMLQTYVDMNILYIHFTHIGLHYIQNITKKHDRIGQKTTDLYNGHPI